MHMPKINGIIEIFLPTHLKVMQVEVTTQREVKKVCCLYANRVYVRLRLIQTIKAVKIRSEYYAGENKWIFFVVQKGNDILVKTSAVIDNPKCSFR
jgi:hypothetical protein